MQLKKTLSSPEKKFYLPAIIAFLLLVYIPEAVNWLVTPEGYVFNGGVLNITDFNVYLSAIRQSAEGAWLFAPQFTPESFPPYFAFIPYMLSGKLMALFGGGVLLWFHILKAISLIWAINNLLALLETTFPKEERLRKTAFFILLFSSGLGWIVLPFIGELTRITPDLFVPEWDLLNAAFASPHFLLGIAFQAAFFRAIIDYFNHSDWRSVRSVAAAGIGLSLTYPYLTAVDGLILGAYLIYQAIRDKRIPWKRILMLGVACLPMVAALAYYGLYLPQDPLYQLLIVDNNTITPPPPIGLLVGFGFLLILAILGMRSWWQRSRPRIVVFWLGINLLAIYLPFSFSGRFISGLYLPISLLAAVGLEEFWLKWIHTRTGKQPAFYRNLTLLLTLPSTILFITYFTMVINSYHIFPYYNKQIELDAAAWLSEVTTDDDLLMAEFPLCNLLPRYGKGRVFNGHFDLTVDMEGKSELVEKFFLPQTSDQWRQDFINQWGITYIYQGRYENAHSEDTSLILPYEIIYQTESDRIYRVP
ncbi:MAG: hypothetical protein ACK2T7_11045 [Anaerolineales bacterium]